MARRLLSLLVLASFVGRASAQVHADPNRDYPVVAEAGAWMVCVAYYTGAEAPELARQMVYQIRSQYKLPAYVFIRVDESAKQQREELEKRQQAETDRARKLGFEIGTATPTPAIPRRTIRVQEQHAVLVGGWPNMETAHKAREAICKWAPLTVRTRAGSDPSDVRISFDPTANQYTKTTVNPFQNAMVIPNPKAPQAKSANAADPFLKTLNADEPYSLLKNPKGWTLLVKEYYGASEVVSVGNKPSEKGVGTSEPGKALEASAATAKEVTGALRQLNFEAYVLHTRQSSLIAIGGFDGPADPAIQRVKQQLTQLTQQMIARSRERRDPIQLFPDPLVIEVPRP